MQAIASAGAAGTSMREGRARNGNGISDPINTSGFHAARAWASKRSARNTIGGMPTPPPMARMRGRAGCSVKPWPIGPSRLSVSPGRRWPSAAVPAPTTLNSTSIHPPSADARMIDNGRRIGRALSQRRCTKLPGVACCAVRGAAMRRMCCCASAAVCCRIRPSSTWIVPRCARGPAAAAAPAAPAAPAVITRAPAADAARPPAPPCAPRRRCAPGRGSPIAARRRLRNRSRRRGSLAAGA